MQFLNVDLELGGASPFPVLAGELSAKLFALFAGREGRLHRADYELRGHAKDPTSTILALAKVVCGLGPRATAQWNRLRMRRFDIGIEAGHEPFSFELAVSDEAVAAVAALRGEIAITTYAPARRARARKRLR